MNSVLIYCFLLTFGHVMAGIVLKNKICGLEPAQTGDERPYVLMFTYYPDSNRCYRFIYDGNDGNENRFFSKGECEEMCKVGPGLKGK